MIMFSTLMQFVKQEIINRDKLGHIIAMFGKSFRLLKKHEIQGLLKKLNLNQIMFCLLIMSTYLEVSKRLKES